MTPATPEALERFRARFQANQDARMEREYPTLDHTGPQYTVEVIPGPKYAKVNAGRGSGRYMVVNATGEIFGIKGYGVIHRGHPYGTLDTVDAFDWGGYRAVRREPVSA